MFLEFFVLPFIMLSIMALLVLLRWRRTYKKKKQFASNQTIFSSLENKASVLILTINTKNKIKYQTKKYYKYQKKNSNQNQSSTSGNLPRYTNTAVCGKEPLHTKWNSSLILGIFFSPFFLSVKNVKIDKMLNPFTRGEIKMQKKS